MHAWPSAPPVDPGAYDEYLHGRSVLADGPRPAFPGFSASKRQYTEQDVSGSDRIFQIGHRSTRLMLRHMRDSPDAYIRLGHPVRGGHYPKESLSEAKEAATAALKLDPSLPEAHFSLAQTLQYDWNWPEAEKEYRLALQLNPNYVGAHLEYGRYVQALGRNDEALAQMRSADESDPFNVGVKENRGAG